MSACSITLAGVPDPASYRPAPGTIPDSPGVYRFRDPQRAVIYVGKAKSLRSRLNSYFSDIAALHPRTAQMVRSAGSVEWTVVSTEVEALQLEYNWIKEFDPRFNVRYRDDKSYPELAVTLGEEYPRLQVMRGAHKKGVRYFGPYAHAWAIREMLDLLLRVFPARTCSAGVFRRSRQIGRPCLLGYIGKCSAPCVGRVTADEHREIVDAFCDFMAGKADQMIRRLEREMSAAAAELDFERAARLRDDLGAIRRAVEKQAVVFGDGTDADVVGITADDLLASVQVFHVRGGRVRGQRGWIVDVDADTAGATAGAGDSAGPALGALVGNFLTQFYGGRAADDGATAVPREILVPALPDGGPEGVDTADLTSWLSGLRGSRVSLRVPQRGDKRALAETVTRNAAGALAQHRLKRASDLTARSAALTELADTLGMDTSPLRIECIDVSHVQGTDVVASLVVFEDGLPKRSDYRRFLIRDRPGDDVASIAEVVRRRFAGAGRQAAEQSSERAPSEGNGLGPEADANGIVSEAGGDTAGRNGPDLNIADRNRPDGGTESDAAPALPPGIDPAHRPPAPLRVPAAAARHRRRGAAGERSGRRPRGHRRRRRRGVRSREAARGGLGAGPGRAGDLPADQRGAVSAAAIAGRGTPVRHHVPPGEAVEIDDGIGPRRHRRRGTRAAQGADPALRLGGGAAPGECRRRDGRARLRAADGARCRGGTGPGIGSGGTQRFRAGSRRPKCPDGDRTGEFVTVFGHGHGHGHGSGVAPVGVL